MNLLGETLQDTFTRKGISRRDFMKFCGVMAGALALPKSTADLIARALESPKRLPVIWLELQDCAGCSEAFLRTPTPTVGELVLDVLSVDYHETIMAASGHAAEAAKQASMEAGGYILVVEGAISTADDGGYCCIAGKSSMDIIREAAKNAVAIVAVGTCATFGGIPKAAPNPTSAVGVMDIIKDKPIINLPGCPVNPVNLSATIVHFLTFNRLPEVDKLLRPLFAYGAKIHDNCERRGHFDAGEFVRIWGDEGHRKGWCLYQMGCKGPVTFHNCPTVRYNNGTSWPVASGHPCIGCSEPGFWDMKTYEPVALYEFAPPEQFPSVEKPSRELDPAAVAISGTAIGFITGAAGAIAYNALTNRSGHQKPAVETEETPEHSPAKDE